MCLILRTGDIPGTLLKNFVEKAIYLEAENNKEILTKKVNTHGNF
jgi:hypothetical protein